MPSYAHVMDPGDGDDGEFEAVFGAKSIDQAVAELMQTGPSQPLDDTPYLAKLFCGHIVTGVTRAQTIRFGSHGAYCEDCEDFQLFVDIVLKRDLVA